MRKAILDFNMQFGFIPEITNKEKLAQADHYVLLGMGGSHLAADIVKDILPDVALQIHEDYSLPEVSSKGIAETLFIASSYSGNTEEILDAAKEAYAKKYNIICIAVGGALIDFARTNSLPYIVLPNVGIQPRLALGYSLIALAHVLNQETLINNLRALAMTLHPAALEQQGKEIAALLEGYIPIIYASNRNRSLAYNWKIKCNETGKIPAFYNLFPELNHNEMTGFDFVEKTNKFSSYFYFIFIKDVQDNKRVQKRFEVTKDLYEKRGQRVIDIAITGNTRVDMIFSNLVLADWVAYHSAILYGAEPEQVPMVEDFKKKMIVNPFYGDK